MRNFSIAGLQLNLDYSNNRELITTKIKNVVKRYPWINMVVVSELAVGGSSRSEEFSLENNIEHFSNLALENDIWLIPGSFYDHNETGVTNVAPVISNKGNIETSCTKIYPFAPYENGIQG